MRQLASVQEVLEVFPVDNSDSLDVLRILGWKVVSKRGEFKVGDKVVYVEIDSILPEKPEFEFMRNKKFKVKTVKLRGQISQGIVFPLSILPKGEYSLWQDVTEIIGITKNEPIENAAARGNFPSFIPKTDETRVQNLQWLLDKYQGELFQVTEKLDGSSVTFYTHNGEFGVCSRNLELRDSRNKYWDTARKYGIEKKLCTFGRNIAIQGELIGEGIQGNKYKLKGHEVRIFSIYDIDEERYLNPYDVTSLCELLRLPQVPILGETILINDIDRLVEKSKGISRLSDCKREGIVLRPSDYLEAVRDMGMSGRVSFKVINPDFLLKYGG